MPRLRALRTTYGAYGLINQGQEFSVPEDLAQKLEAKGIVERVWEAPLLIHTKVIAIAPENKDLCASPEDKSYIRKKR